MDRNLYKIQSRINAGFDKFGLNKDEKYKISSTEVNYEEFEKEISRLIELTQKEWKFENYHSIFVYGPTGVGKSEIIKQIAEKYNCVYHKLEIQKVPIEQFEGFPYLENRDEKKVVRLASPTVLPDPDSDKVWLLHLDEFNKAESDKMAAVMNLVLTGEIGGSADYNKKTGKSEKYKLPKKTIIIGSGNFKIQESVENLNLVNQMDTATSERFHRTLFLDYNAESWLRCYASLPYSFQFNGIPINLTSRIMPIVMYFIMDKMLEEGNKNPFLIPVSVRPDEGGSERTMSPRSWTLVSDNMILDGLEQWYKLPKKEQERYGDFDTFLSKPSRQIQLLSGQTPEFGLEGQKIIREIISRYIYFAENRVLPEDVLLNYKAFREKIAEIKKKKGVILYLLLGIGYYIEILDELADINLSAINISTFIQDTDIPAEDLVAFIQILDKSKNEICKQLHDVLYDISERYKNAYSGYFYTSEIELKNGK